MTCRESLGTLSGNEYTSRPPEESNIVGLTRSHFLAMHDIVVPLTYPLGICLTGESVTSKWQAVDYFLVQET